MSDASDAALLTLRLPRRLEAPSAARRALAALNGDLHLISSARLRDAQLLVSELVANAIRHAHAPADGVVVEVRATPTTMRVEILDSGTGFDPAALPAPTHDAAGGWGLRIVDVMAHRWGVGPAAAGGTVVWFEIDRPAGGTPLEPTGDAQPPAGI
jgi:serine/threonine-protein kinase RsbW